MNESFNCDIAIKIDLHHKKKYILFNIDCFFYLNVISMSWTVSVAIMPLLCLIFNMGNINCNTTSFLFRGIVDICVAFLLSQIEIR